MDKKIGPKYMPRICRAPEPGDEAAQNPDDTEKEAEAGGEASSSWRQTLDQASNERRRSRSARGRGAEEEEQSEQPEQGLRRIPKQPAEPPQRYLCEQAEGRTSFGPIGPKMTLGALHGPPKPPCVLAEVRARPSRGTDDEREGGEEGPRGGQQADCRPIPEKVRLIARKLSIARKQEEARRAETRDEKS